VPEKTETADMLASYLKFVEFMKAEQLVGTDPTFMVSFCAGYAAGRMDECRRAVEFTRSVQRVVDEEAVKLPRSSKSRSPKPRPPTVG